MGSYYLRTDCDKLKINTINSKVTNTITQSEVVDNDSMKEIKQNHKTNAWIEKKSEKTTKETNNQ